MTQALTPRGEQILSRLAPFANPAHGPNRYNTPWRPGADGGTLGVSVGRTGMLVWMDHKTGEAGGERELALRLGLDPSRPGASASVEKPAPGDLRTYAEAHGAPVEVFMAAGWQQVTRHNRPALRIPTLGGDRFRFLDTNRSGAKVATIKGWQRCWYRLDEAVAIAEASGQPLVIANGEASTVVAQYHGVAATCVPGGEKASMPEELLAELLECWSGQVIVAFDADTTGRQAGPALATQLREAGLPAWAVDMWPGIDSGDDLADFCKLYQDEAADAIIECRELFDTYIDSHSHCQIVQEARRTTFTMHREVDFALIREPSWVLPGEVQTDAYHLIYGASGSGKTFYALDRALRVAATGRRSLYIATEDLTGLRMRLRAWRHYYPNMPGELLWLEMPYGLDLTDAEQVDELVRVLKGQALDLITIDTLREAHTGDENSSMDMAKVNRAIQRLIRETGAAVDVVHHSGVNEGRERGSTALSANCDLKFKVSSDDETVTVSCEKYRHGVPPQPRHYRITPVESAGGSAVLVPATVENRPKAGSRLSASQRKVLETLAMSIFRETGAKTAQIAESTAIASSTLFRVLSGLKDIGYLSQGAKGDPYTITQAGLETLVRNSAPVSTTPTTLINDSRSLYESASIPATLSITSTTLRGGSEESGKSELIKREMPPVEPAQQAPEPAQQAPEPAQQAPEKVQRGKFTRGLMSLPAGSRLAKCDYKGNETRFGDKWMVILADGTRVGPHDTPQAAVFWAVKETPAAD